jgi:hypothetical protein
MPPLSEKEKADYPLWDNRLTGLSLLASGWLAALLVFPVIYFVTLNPLFSALINRYSFQPKPILIRTGKDDSEGQRFLLKMS